MSGKYTVIVITYNQTFERVRFTLESIIKQNFDDYTIVVADDGSVENHYEEIKEYFEEKNFDRYLLVDNKSNKGTVKNILSALELIQSKYVKYIGAGDAFFHADVLKETYDYMEKEGCGMCFGLMQGYFAKEGKYQLVQNTTPFDIESFRRNDDGDIMRNMIRYGNNVYGPTIFTRTDLLREYLEQMQDKVLYVEDLFQIQHRLLGRKVGFLDQYLVYYEENVGVTSKKNKGSFAEKMAIDISNYFHWMYELFPDDVNLIKRKKLEFLYHFKDIYVRTLVRFFVNPGAALYLINHYWQVYRNKYRPHEERVGLLELLTK